LVILHRIPYPIAERIFFAINESDLKPENEGKHMTIPVGRIKSEGRMQDAGVTVKFVRCDSTQYPPACRAEIIGQILAAPTVNIDTPP